ncbi:unnamed protein product [Phytophthora fragariaefolia]|uniref:Unnamed protein product n=1 Tax=Phytophthora fragariaefolia TaxID=1490495 RepID=A0A9W6XCG3_9STRA|nr:unnamed protein product [Phytophthora fragariaefolia]
MGRLDVTCRPEEVPQPLSPAQARANLADYPVVWKDLRRDVKLLMEDRLEYPAALALAGEDKYLHTGFPLDDLTIMPQSMVHWHRLDSAPWTKYVPRRYFTVDSVALEGLRRTGTHIPEWRVTPAPSLDDGEIDLLESEGEVADKTKKDEVYNPHQDLDDGMDDEDEDPDEASDDGVLNVAQRSNKRRRLSKSSAEASTPKKLKAKSPVKPKLKAFLTTRPSSKLSDTRRTEVFFHRRADLGHEVVRGLEDWVDFMEENVEALWHATHWILLDRNSSSKFIRKTSVGRVKLRESVRKKVTTREKQLKKIAPASVGNEPVLWKFPKRICYWVLMSRSHTKPGTDANYSLKEQVELLDAREPARLQWGACSSDEERIAHLPEDVRRKLIPSGKRDYVDD